MNRKFHCGRLVINKDGVVKRLDLAYGGGTRDCTLSHIDMGFDEIHDRLRELFSLDRTNRNSKLYDFQRTELDTNRYLTFFDYVQKNGLKFNGTLLYLCTPADNENTVCSPSPEKVEQQHKLPFELIPQVEADSSTPTVLIKIADSPPIDRKPSIDNHIVENLRISSSTSFSNYSFEKSLNEFIDYLRNLIKQYNHESIFIQLFEYICTLQGLSSITLDRLKKQIQPVDEHEKQFYNNALDKLEKLSRSIKAFIELNKMKISHIDQHSRIIDLFSQFHQNFNILRDQWVNNMNNNRRSTSFSSTNHSIDPAPSTSFSSSSYSRYHSETNSRKQSRALSPSPQRSYRVSTSEDNNNEKYSLFKNILKSLDHLSDVLHNLRFTSFYHLVKSIIHEIESCRSNINLSEYRSLYDAEKTVISVEKRLTDRLNNEYHRVSPHGIHQQLQYSFDKTLDAIKHLLNSFHYYQSQANKNKRPRTTRPPLLPNPPSTTNKESKPRINFNQQQTRIDDNDDDDQSSEASHSSFGDEVLMEVARDAYEQRPNRYK